VVRRAQQVAPLFSTRASKRDCARRRKVADFFLLIRPGETDWAQYAGCSRNTRAERHHSWPSLMPSQKVLLPSSESRDCSTYADSPSANLDVPALGFSRW